MKISITLSSKPGNKSEYDWVDISDGNDRIGKARCKIDKSTIIIHNISIYPEWAGQGYGKEFISYCKGNFAVIVADRVRYSAVGFWESMGFSNNNDGSWSYRNEATDGNQDQW